MAGKPISGLGPVTDILTTDYIELYRPTELLKTDQNKKILLPDFMGGTSGIPFNIGIGVAAGTYVPLHLKVASGDCQIVTENAAGAKNLFSTGAGGTCFGGAITSHDFRLLSNGSYRIKIRADGETEFPYAYINDINGHSGIRTLVISGDTNEIGYNSSWAESKKDIVDMEEVDIEFLRNLRIVKYKPIKGNGQERHGLIAHEVDQVFPPAVFSDTFHVQPDGSHTPITPDKFGNWKELKQVDLKNTKYLKTAKVITSWKGPDDPVTKDEEIEVENVAAGVEINEILPALLKGFQLAMGRIEALEAEVLALKQ